MDSLWGMSRQQSELMDMISSVRGASCPLGTRAPPADIVDGGTVTGTRTDASIGQSPVGPAVIVQAVTVIMATVVGLTFMFGFGNVLALALRLGVPPWVAPLVAPAVDLSILGLLLGIRYLALNDTPVEVLRALRRLIVVTLALNVADPVIAGNFGRATFDSVGRFC